MEEIQNPATSVNSSNVKSGINGKKIYFIILIGLALVAVAYSVRYMTNVHQQSQNYTEQQTAVRFGDIQTISGPILEVDKKYVVPESLEVSATVDTHTNRKSLYEAIVYNADIEMQGTIKLDASIINKGNVFLTIHANTEQITELKPVKINGEEFYWVAGMHGDRFVATIPAKPEWINSYLTFSTSFSTDGSRGLFIREIGINNTIKINGKSYNKQYSNSQLTNAKFIKGDNSGNGVFSTQWDSESEDIYADNAVPNGIVYKEAHGYIGVNYLTNVQTYRKVNRSITYCFLIIYLTLAGVLIIEVTTRRNLSLLYYILVGAALVIFYALLLSFAEIIGFDYSYLIAAAMTIVLIASFIYRSLYSFKIAGLMATTLAFLYALCFVLMNLKDYALLMGSILIFVVLAIIMHVYAKLSFNKSQEA